MPSDSSIAGVLRGHGWLLVPVLLVWLLLLRPVNDVDIFWQLRLGDLMLDSGWLITREPFAATHLNEPLPQLSVLAQLLLALMRRIAGWRGVQLIDALAWSGGFVAAGLAARRRGAGNLALGLALVVCIAVAFPFSGLRPQSFAVLGFGLLLLLVQHQTLRFGTWLGLGAALLVLWQNLHPSVSVAAIYLAARGGPGWLAWLGWLGPERRAAPPWHETALCLIAALATFATPAGFGVLAVSLANAQQSVAMGATEWLSLLDPASRDFLPWFAVLHAVIGVLVFQHRRSLDLADIAGAVVFLVMALVSARFMLFWALALVPLAAGREPGSKKAAGSRAALLLYPAGALLALLLVILRGPVTMDSGIPVQGIERLKAAGIKGTIFCGFAFGGPVIDAGWPDWQVGFDGRYWRYSDAEWSLYRDILAGKADLAAITTRYRPSAWLLSTVTDPALIAALRADTSHWREIQADATSVTFIPRP